MSTENPYASPNADLNQVNSRRFAGFWMRLVASIIDSLLMVIVMFPLLYAAYGGEMFAGERMVMGGADVLISYVMPFVLYVFF